MLGKFVKPFWGIRAFFYKIVFHKIGALSYLGKPIFITGGKKVEIGSKVRIFPGMRLEVHNKGRVTISDDVVIGQNVHITCGQSLIIGSKTLITPNVVITDIDHNYTDIGIHVVKQEYITSPTIIGENCFIGAGAVIQAGSVLGKQCIVGANSVVRGCFPDYSVIVGSPAKVVKRFNDAN